jgi:hypothetical protein
MTEAEWLYSNDAGAMIEFLWQRQGIQPREIDLRFGGNVRESEPPQSEVALLKRAAYFADFAMIYPSLTPKGPPPKSYYPFLSAELLREFVGYSFPP